MFGMCKHNTHSKDYKWCLLIVSKIGITWSIRTKPELINYQPRTNYKTFLSSIYYLFHLFLTSGWIMFLCKLCFKPLYYLLNFLPLQFTMKSWVTCQTCPVDVPIWKFWIFALPVKNRYRYVIHGLLLLKTIFSLNHLFLYWSPESPLKVPYRSWTLGPSGDIPGMSCAGWVLLFLQPI